jgi:mRNA-degrading endonuclease RelE of RelBE toxin-antitoxin system
MSFHIDISPDAQSHLESLRKRDQAILLTAIERQLRHTPIAVTRNRKPMKSNIISTWELRVGSFRVYL